MVKDSIKEQCSTQKFEEHVCEKVREVFHGNQEQISDNAEEDQRAVIDQEYGISSLERNQSFTDVQEYITEVLVPTKFKADSVQITNEKLKGKSVVTRLKMWKQSNRELKGSHMAQKGLHYQLRHPKTYEDYY